MSLRSFQAYPIPGRPLDLAIASAIASILALSLSSGQGVGDLKGWRMRLSSRSWRGSGIDNGEHATLVERAIVQHVEETWRDPRHGLCELRGKPR
jgi:hypothetical protein